MPTIILSVPPAADDLSVFLREPWSRFWDEVTHDAAPSVEARVGTFVRLKSGTPLPDFGAAAPVIWIEDLDQLEEVRSNGTCQTVVFAPTRAAALDAIARQRHGLAAKYRLKAGHVLTVDDVMTVLGGPGVAEAQRGALLGRTLCYDLNAGEPITFGMIICEQEEGA